MRQRFFSAALIGRRSGVVIIAAIVLHGCAGSTFGEAKLLDFNDIYKKDNPISPEFKLETLGDNLFSISLHQGEILISPGSVRHSLLKKAGLVVASDICGKLKRSLGKFDWEPHGSGGWVHVTVTFECAL